MDDQPTDTLKALHEVTVNPPPFSIGLIPIVDQQFKNVFCLDPVGSG